VDDGIERMNRKQGLERSLIAQIRAHEVQRPTTNGPHPPQRLRLAIAEIIDHDQLMPRGEQLNAGVAADITSATSDQYLHQRLLATWAPLTQSTAPEKNSGMQYNDSC
jgi:hypothetical protein